MLFNSTEFLVFYVVVALLYWGLALAGTWWRLRKGLLLVASYGFYMSWNPPFVLLLLVSTVIDFVAGARIHAARRQGARRAWLLLSLVGNLGILGYFKYGAFVFETVAGGSATPMPEFLRVVLPLGISFYTFQSMSYSIDVYRGVLAPQRSALDFALYVSFFPQLVAGPIVRAGYFLPQLARPPGLAAPRAERAMMLIALGLFKKVVCADVLGEYVDLVFADLEGHGGVNLLVAIYAYTFQIYFDFSGYSDLAIGLAGLLGFELPENFRLPYMAENPTEYWRRWHISLSSWLHDYLYVPLGGNRTGTIRTYCNVMITMLLGGLWHGAAWHFVVWGGYHGILLVVHRRFFRDRPRRDGFWWRLGRRLGNFHLQCVGYVIFRVQEVGDVARFFQNLVEPGLVTSPAFTRALVWSAAAFAIHVAIADRRPGRRFLRMPPLAQAGAYACVAVLVYLFSPATQRFIYFQF